MANSIVLAKNYANLLDEVYAGASVTADLTGDPNMVRAGVNANEICYMQVNTTGLGDYDRNSGYTQGSVDLHWETAKYNYDRGTKISVDSMDDQETFNKAMGAAGGELQRTKVAPEADAFTFATICGFEGITMVKETLAEANAFLAALLVAKNKMDEDEVPEEGRILYATPTLINGIMALDTTKSREVLNSYKIVKKVPQSRFYTHIDLLDGKSPGEEAGHFRKSKGEFVKTSDTAINSEKTYYTKSGEDYTAVASPNVSAIGNYYENETEGKNINFMIVHKPAIIKHDKHVVGDIIPAKLNPNSDADILKYRKYGIVDFYKGKAAGFYVNYAG